MDNFELLVFMVILEQLVVPTLRGSALAGWDVIADLTGNLEHSFSQLTP